MIELVLCLKPLDRHSGPGQLTAKGHVASFGSLLVLQTRFKGEGDGCGKIKLTVVFFGGFYVNLLVTVIRSKHRTSTLRADKNR